jgi:hypothetical protein
LGNMHGEASLIFSGADALDPKKPWRTDVSSGDYATALEAVREGVAEELRERAAQGVDAPEEERAVQADDVAMLKVALAILEGAM